MTTSHILGFPHIGAKRELKKALENYWRGHINQAQLIDTGKTLQRQHWQLQKTAGLDFVTVGDFAWYDHVLNMSALLGVIPKRFRTTQHPFNLDTYFCMARGQAPNGLENIPSAMTKWFDANYHYIVPEFAKNQLFQITYRHFFETIDDALSLGYHVKPVLIGPLTYLYLGKSEDPSVEKLSLLNNLLFAYAHILTQLQKKGIAWVQIDEPILTLDLDENWKHAFQKAYTTLSTSPVKLLLTTYFGALDHHLDLISTLNTAGLHIDLCSAPTQLDRVLSDYPKDRVLSLGVVNGRNIWKNDFSHSLTLLNQAKKMVGENNLWIGSSCSLIHSPVDLQQETKLNPDIKNWLAFAKQKVEEISTLAKIATTGNQAYADILNQNHNAIASKKTSALINHQNVQARMRDFDERASYQRADYATRKRIQAESLSLPLLPTTTIGSFPQTDDIRRIRRDYRAKKISEATYVAAMQAEIQHDIQAQEKLGLDVLVHGEPERNDMVEYFGELLEGFAFTENGWVQSYGSRYVKPPIIYGDVYRKAPMTVDWIRFAQSQTKKPVKGMLTGPTTILAWSFPRDDQPLAKTALQIALALRDEVLDLEKAGIQIIQIDEPAFREKVPLRQSERDAYFAWAIRCFRVVSGGVKNETQIHTHMCYSNFNQIMAQIAALDADVITIESSRSDMQLLRAFNAFQYPNDIGPGVYDIHSPRIPTTEEMASRIQQILSVLPIERVWVNPDCGLKTRKWPEVNESLKNMVDAAHHARITFLGIKPTARKGSYATSYSI